MDISKILQSAQASGVIYTLDSVIQLVRNSVLSDEQKQEVIASLPALNDEALQITGYALAHANEQKKKIDEEYTKKQETILGDFEQELHELVANARKDAEAQDEVDTARQLCNLEEALKTA